MSGVSIVIAPSAEDVAMYGSAPLADNLWPVGTRVSFGGRRQTIASYSGRSVVITDNERGVDTVLNFDEAVSWWGMER